MLADILTMNTGQSIIPANSSHVVIKKDTQVTKSKPIKGAPTKKRQYKKKKNESSSQKSAKTKIYDLDLSMNNLSLREDDPDGKNGFKRKNGCYYHAPIKGAPAKKRRCKKKPDGTSQRSAKENTYDLDLGTGDLASAEEDDISMPMKGAPAKKRQLKRKKSGCSSQRSANADTYDLDLGTGDLASAEEDDISMPIKGAPANKRRCKKKKPDGTSQRSAKANPYDLDLGTGDLASAEEDDISMPRLGHWPWCSTAEGETEDKRFRFRLASIPGPHNKPSCIGIGRRIIFDRVWSQLDDIAAPTPNGLDSKNELISEIQNEWTIQPKTIPSSEEDDALTRSTSKQPVETQEVDLFAEIDLLAEAVPSCSSVPDCEIRKKKFHGF